MQHRMRSGGAIYKVEDNDNSNISNVKTILTVQQYY